MNIFRNQYLVCVKPGFSIPDGFSQYDFLHLSILAETHLDVHVVETEDRAAALIGFAVNPTVPEATNHQIAAWLGKSPDRRSFENRVSRLSGRFVALYSDFDGQIALTDACGLRQLLYHFDTAGNPQLTSSLGLFLALNNTRIQSPQEIDALADSSTVRNQEMALYGEITVDSRLKRLIPNHRLDLRSQQVSRQSLNVPTSRTEDEILELISNSLRGTYEALHLRKRTLLQGLTAGWDSRLLCAASRHFAHHIRYFAFPGSGRADRDVPPALGNHLGISFELFHTEPLRPDFLELFQANNPTNRVLEKTTHIQYHFDHHNSKRHLVINGNGGEISRHYYGFSKRNFSLNEIIKLAHYWRHRDLFYEELSGWYSGAKQASEESVIPIIDLFYWEQRMGNWGALYPSEQDLAIEEFSPLNNREMILYFLAITPEHRDFPDYIFHRKLIAHLWSETLDLPINPGSTGFLSKIKRRYKNTRLGLWLRSLQS